MNPTEMYKALETIESVCSAFKSSYYPTMKKTFTDSGKLEMLNKDKELIDEIKEYSNKINNCVDRISFKKDYI